MRGHRKLRLSTDLIDLLKLFKPISLWSVSTTDLALKLGGREGELEWGVEVVLLLLGPVHHLPAPHHQEPAVPDVCRVQLEI